jgi:hypothetical protein
MHVNGGFGSQAGCDIQLPSFAANTVCVLPRGTSSGIAANCGGG